MFIATSPEVVRPVLDLEEEEAIILKITKELLLVLRVEESDNLEGAYKWCCAGGFQVGIPRPRLLRPTCMNDKQKATTR